LITGLYIIGKFIVSAIVKIIILGKKYILYKYAKARSQKGLFLKTIQGSKMYIDINDPGISKELLYTGVHETRTTNIVHDVLQKEMTVIDIGANIGYYALMESSLVGRKGRVFAIEPVLQNFQLLNKSIAENGYENIETFNLAASNKTGVSKFFLTDASNWGSMVDVDTDDKSKYIKNRMLTLKRGQVDVNTTTIDEFVKNNKIDVVNFFRMDIEGFEIQAIEGMQNTIRRMKPPFFILMEVHNNVFKNPYKSLESTFRFLEEQNMIPIKIIAKSKEFNKPIMGDWVKTLLSENKLGVNHIILEKVS